MSQFENVPICLPGAIRRACPTEAIRRIFVSNRFYNSDDVTMLRCYDVTALRRSIFVI